LLHQNGFSRIWRPALNGCGLQSRCRGRGEQYTECAEALAMVATGNASFSCRTIREPRTQPAICASSRIVFIHPQGDCSAL